MDIERNRAISPSFLYEAHNEGSAYRWVSASCEGPWLEQIVRDLTDAMDGFVVGFKYLIRDRDPLFTTSFLGILKDAGVNSVRPPRRSPNLNAFFSKDL